MNLLSDVITYIRRIIKTPSNAVITDNLLIDYINRFWMMDVDARIQLFDLKVKYQFMTTPGVDRYNMPLYSVQTEPGSQTIGMFPVYQGFTGPASINGVEVSFQTQERSFFGNYPNLVQNLFPVATGTGVLNDTYTFQLPILGNTGTPANPPLQGILRGHVDIAGIIANNQGNVDPPITNTAGAITSIPAIPVTSINSAFFINTLDDTGANVTIADSGQFLQGNINYGLLMLPGKAPNGNLPLAGGYSITSNTVNYFTGQVSVTIPGTIPIGENINVNCFYFQTGLPRMVLFYNNVLTLRSPPAFSYLVELEAFLSPAAFLNTTQAIPFGYMAEYLARGAARKILADTGDQEQLQFYEPFFREQEMLVWKRSQRQWTATRTETIYSQGMNQGQAGMINNGGQTL